MNRFYIAVGIVKYDGLFDLHIYEKWIQLEAYQIQTWRYQVSIFKNLKYNHFHRIFITMKFIILVAAMIYLVESQRPPYAGSSNRYPVVLPRFREEQEATSTVASPEDVNNRINVESANSAPTFNEAVTTSTIPTDLPVDAMGDIELINRIKTWPREKQPFWYINWQQIQAHRGDNTNQNPQSSSSPKPFFAG